MDQSIMVSTEDRVKDLLDGRPVLVTGADGFVGSHLTERLVELGANVHVFVHATSPWHRWESQVVSMA